MDSKTTIQVSIIMPTYNRAHCIGRAIESIINQSFVNWELIIIDDASTDETQKVLNEWQARDARIIVIRNKINQYPDISKTLNQGLAAARGKYIARIDDDDYWQSPEKLKKQISFLHNNPDYIIVGTGVVVIDGNGVERYRYLKNETDEAIRKSVLSANPFTHSSVVYLKDVARAVGGYEEPYAEDWTLWLKLGMRGKLYNIPEYLIYYEMAGQNKSWQFQREQSKTILEIISRFRYNYPNFYRGYVLNCMAYWYTFLPVSVRNLWHPLASRFKRSL